MSLVIDRTDGGWLRYFDGSSVPCGYAHPGAQSLKLVRPVVTHATPFYFPMPQLLADFSVHSPSIPVVFHRTGIACGRPQSRRSRICVTGLPHSSQPSCRKPLARTFDFTTAPGVLRHSRDLTASRPRIRILRHPNPIRNRNSHRTSHLPQPSNPLGL